jgi:hypothetical protein
VSLSHTLFFLFPLHHPPVFLGPLALSLSSSSLPMGPSAGGLRPFLARRSATSATNLQHHTQRARRGASSPRRSPVAGPERDGGRRRRDRWGGRRKRERGTREDRWAVEGKKKKRCERVTRGSRMPKPL